MSDGTPPDLQQLWILYQDRDSLGRVTLLKKNTGVKKCQIFCAVRNVPESPHNIKILLDLLRVEKLPVSFLFDLNVTSVKIKINI